MARQLDMTSATVVIASYRRVGRLAACLEAVRGQTRPADDVVVVFHLGDDETAAHVVRIAVDWPELRLVHADGEGSVAAYNTGLAAARGSLVAYVDDDAVPHPDWLERIVATFEQDQRIAAVGGRDVVIFDGRIETVEPRFGIHSGPPEVGRVQWFGRMIANHHVGAGPPQDVDVLKGVNMSFRRAAVAGHGFDERLRGRGALVHSEVSICLPLRRRGLRIIYDPAIVVMHYPAPRPAGDHRRMSTSAVTEAVHNETLAILDYFGPLRRLVFAVWWVAIGSTEAPGLAVLIRDLIRRRPEAWASFLAAQRGRVAGVATSLWCPRDLRQAGSARDV